MRNEDDRPGDGDRLMGTVTTPGASAKRKVHENCDRLYLYI